VEEQTPFCGSCGAPQIRVAVPEEATQSLNDPATPPLEPGTPAAVDPPAIPVHFDVPAGIQWRRFVRIVFPFAFASGMCTAFFGPFGFVVLIISVVLCIRRYRRANPGGFTAAYGAQLGALTAVLSFPSFLLFFGMIVAAAPEMFHEVMLRPLQQRAAQGPEYQEMLRWVSTREGFLVLVAMSIVVLLFFLVALATAAGALEGSRKG